MTRLVLALLLLSACRCPFAGCAPAPECDRSRTYPTVQCLVDGSCVQWIDGEPLALSQCPEDLR